MKPPFTALLVLAVAGCCAAWSPAQAQARPERRVATVPEGVQVPAWNELSPDQRRDLAHLAQRWDQLPASRRVAILERWQRWRALPPAQRETLRRGERNFRSMSPEMREQMRRSLAAVGRLPPEQQRRLRQLWRELTPEQRRRWLERGGPGLSPPPPLSQSR